VEQGPVRTVLKHPQHPYTQGLLKTIPNDVAPDQPLYAIRGNVPSLLSPAAGCAFAPRCDHVMEACRQAIPPAYALSQDHHVACFLHRHQAVTRP
jgi:oligopeptide/dipeptide ABC transporter ATP-binding protein